MALFRRAAQLLEGFTCLGNFVVIVYDDTERAVSRWVDDLLVEKLLSLRLRQDDVIHGNARSEEGNVVELVESLTYLDGPERFRTDGRVSILILLETEEDFDVLSG
ncbi:hypothetical protein BON30_17985 [Cystobacter ferrugineus]|uniref:Uncharacterized protein n=1 Tax=Cystobacter ferrugineus TaxID=83449 RepID=A0A1L9BAX7_9BACT|nr:hypothetical protein BON30_17985 [Cystobacter ferrugineus]